MDIKARMTGKIIAVNVKAGDTVKRGEVIGTMEAMKMEQPIPSPKDGTIKEIKVAVDDKVRSGAVIAVVE